jgi:putative ATP-dependent endonuclease of OLD family
MRISKVRIENFRGLKELELDFDSTTILIGENNSGKTSVLDALRLCLRELGPRRRVVFDSFDFHLESGDAEPHSAAPILIEICFSEHSAGEWTDLLVGRLSRNKILQVDGLGARHVFLRVTCAYDVATRDIEQNWCFLNLNHQPLTGVSENALAAFQREVAFFYLTALRDAAHHFDAKGPFWRPFLKDTQLSPEKKAEIEQKLHEVNDLVVASHTSFEQARDRLSRVQDVVSMAGGDVVSIEAVPGRMFDMLAKAQIHLGAATGAKVPVGRHGEGTQSLAVLMLFSAFLDAWPNGIPIVALEEPEAHLHPSAVRALWDILNIIHGQKLISTHSGDLLSEVDVHSVRRLARIEGGVMAYRVPPMLLDAEETRKFNYHVRRSRGELLFARCWLLVEGETEAWIYPAAARALSMKLHREGIRVVEYSQSDVGLLAKVANALGIPWYCVVDDDSGRAKYETSIINSLAGISVGERLVFPYYNMEAHLIENGYHDIYLQYMPEQNLRKVTKRHGESGYTTEFLNNFPKKNAKTRAAANVASEMESRGRLGVSSELRSVLEKVFALVRAQ